MLGFGKRSFSDLSEQEVIALAIAAEEEDSRIFATYADALRSDFGASAELFDEMAAEENEHRRLLIDLHREKFGESIPFVRRQDVRGFVQRRPFWMMRGLGIEKIREQAQLMEVEARRFYLRAAERSTDASTRKLLGDLAEAERNHVTLAEELGETHLTDEAISTERRMERKLFLLQIVQPGLAGLMDGSVSTLAPLFAAAFATQSTHETFLVGIAASVGAGISMGFAEALSDDGTLTGRGSPWIRGVASGLMTAIGGIGHTLPYLLADFWLATWLAIGVVVLELGAISYIRYKYMDTAFLTAAFQIVVGGLLVFGAGILIGNA
jgi:rubrerythrin